MSDQVLLQEALTRSIIGAFYEVYRSCGYGLLEQMYVSGMERELRARGHRVSRELPVRVMYKGEHVGSQRLDMVIDDLVIVEAKATEKLPESAFQQLVSYLRCTEYEIGLLLHFGPKPSFRRGIWENRLKYPDLGSVKSVPPVQSPKPPS
jgi:GxxExxY protein